MGRISIPAFLWRIVMRTASSLFRFIASLFLIGYSVLPVFAETIRCEPVYPVFCQNVHVGCAGRSSLPTNGFLITVEANGVDVVFDGGEAWMVQAPELKGERVIRKSDSRDWIRIDRRDRFSHRIYRKGTAFMAFGKCTRG